jgi:hypothetical protein
VGDSVGGNSCLSTGFRQAFDGSRFQSAWLRAGQWRVGGAQLDSGKGNALVQRDITNKTPEFSDAA